MARDHVRDIILAPSRSFAPKAPLEIGLIFGGIGPEHEASLSSARTVLSHIDRDRYNLTQFGICKDGSWAVGDGAWDRLYRNADTTLLPSVIRDLPTEFPLGPVKTFRRYPDESAFENLDLIFPLVDGLGGEDGVLQGLLRLGGKPVTGSDLLSSAQCYDKWTTKRLARDAGIAVAKGIRVLRDEATCVTEQRIEAEIGRWDLLVKPVACGSSFGVSHIRDRSGLRSALSLALQYGDAALVEEYIPNLECFVAVLGNSPELTISKPVIDGVLRDRHSTYHDKYIADLPPLRCPSGLGEAVDRTASGLARAAYEALGCSGFARVDLFLRLDSGQLLLNEINTIPAFAVDCAFPTGMACEGFDYPRLLDRIIELAIEKHQKSDTVGGKVSLPMASAPRVQALS